MIFWAGRARTLNCTLCPHGGDIMSVARAAGRKIQPPADGVNLAFSFVRQGEMLSFSEKRKRPENLKLLN